MRRVVKAGRWPGHFRVFRAPWGYFQITTFEQRAGESVSATLEDCADGAALVGVFDDDLGDQSPSLASEAVELAYVKPILRHLDSVLPAIHGTSQRVRGDVCHSMRGSEGWRLRRGLWRLCGG